MTDTATAKPRGSTELDWTRERLGCYTGLYEAEARVVTPRSVDELREVFRQAREEGRRVTLRAGGNSFDAQALNDDIVVSMTGLDSIEVVGDELVRVGPGARWGDIFKT